MMGTSLQRPFAPTPDPRFVYRDGSYSHVLADVTEGLRRREGLILVTGAAGTGKSMLCNDVLALSRLDRSVFPSLVSDPWVSVEELVGLVLSDCGMPKPAAVTRHDLVGALKRFLASLSSQGAHVLLIIDEAQNLRPEVVEHLRLFASTDSGGRQALQILLVGQPELEKLFESPQLDQRVARRCPLKSFDAEETKRYIEHRLRTAHGSSRRSAPPLIFGEALEGATMDRFTPAAVREVVALSSGAPRAIDMLCDRTLELASQRNMPQVDRSLVREVARQMRMPARPLRFAHASSAMVATALVAGLPPIAWYWASQMPPHLAQTKAAPVERAVADPFDFRTLRVVPAVSVEVGSFPSGARADAVASKLGGLGLPASARPDFTGVSHLVMIGPYVSDDEARAAQSTVGAQGFADARILHQQTLVPGALDATDGDGLPRIVAITPGGKRISLVMEMAAAPGRLTTQRVSATVLEVEAGPVSGTIHQQDVTTNGAAPLIDHIALRSVVLPDGGRVVRARVTLTEASLSRVRMVGRRVYVDLSSAEPASDGVLQLRTPVSQTATSIGRPPAGDDQYRQSAAAAAARFDEIQPFLLSAVASPTPDVLRAVAGTLSDLRSTLERVSVPQSAAQDHALLASAVSAALTAVQLDYPGDRGAKAREAIATMQSVKALSSVRPEAGPVLTLADGTRRPK